MKIKKLPFSISLLLLTLFNVVSSSAFSFPSETLDLNSRNSYTLKIQQNTKAIFTEEASVSVVIEIASNQDYFNSGGIGINSFDSSESLSHTYTYNLWLHNPDLKHLLSQHIFPFQFFW
ncbi:hypothetical protein [Gillisia sp. JM1]|uniref:hypothetical protein n=1 Tax=Gillisia sp. JM1 TaxID=1283286 RepID=UPI00047D5F8A|nr:hypothetical protein [Gillisia sp. JM1]